MPKPESELAGEVLSHFDEVGPTSENFSVLTFQEIAAWSSITGTRIGPWEASILKKLSRFYLTQHNKSTDPNCPPPSYSPKISISKRRQVVNEDFRSMMRGFKKDGNRD